MRPTARCFKISSNFFQRYRTQLHRWSFSIYPILPKGTALGRTVLLCIYAKPFSLLHFVVLQLQIGTGVQLRFYLVICCTFSLVMFELMVYFTNRDEASVLIIPIFADPFAFVSLRIVCLYPGKRVDLYEFFATLHNVV